MKYLVFCYNFLFVYVELSLYNTVRQHDVVTITIHVVVKHFKLSPLPHMHTHKSQKFAIQQNALLPTAVNTATVINIYIKFTNGNVSAN